MTERSYEDLEAESLDVLIGMQDVEGIPHVIIQFVGKNISLVLPKKAAIEFANLVLKHARQQ